MILFPLSFAGDIVYTSPNTYSLILKSHHPISVVHFLSIAGAAVFCCCVYVCAHCPHNAQPLSNLIFISFPFVTVDADNTPIK